MNNNLPDAPPEKLAELMLRADGGDADACRELLHYYMVECDPADAESAVPWAAKGARQGDATCLYFMGQFYLNGQGGVEQNDEKAAYYLNAAAEMDHPSAAYKLALLMAGSQGGLPCDFAKILTLLKTAYDGGVGEEIPELADAVLSFLQEKAGPETPELCFAYAWACFNGLFCPQNYERAAQYYYEAAKADHANAQYELGLCYLAGKGVPQSSQKAEMWIHLAALQGLPMAEYEEGSFYAMGDGVPQDDAEAFKWFSLAAEHDHPGANAAVGVFYEAGKVVEKDVDKAVPFYERSVELGSPKGFYHLGCCYVFGNGVRQKVKKGVALLQQAAAMGFADAERKMQTVLASLKKSAEQGDLNALAELGFIYYEVLPEPLWDEAYRCFSRAAEQDHPRGLFGLGQCLIYARGTAQDTERGLALIVRAAMAGEPDALAVYGHFMVEMSDTQEKRDEGLELLRSAAANGSELAEEYLAEE